jgi:hypothetical protein
MNAELTSEDKTRIEAEELYRAEIRAKLEIPKQPRETPRVNKDQLEREEERRVARQVTLTVVSLVATLIAIIALSSNLQNLPKNTVQEAKTDQRFSFAIACERLAKKQLKSPSTAEFTNASQQQKEISSTTTGLTWDGWVDSENSFGANLRSYFTCDYNETSDRVKVTFSSR